MVLASWHVHEDSTLKHYDLMGHIEETCRNYFGFSITAEMTRCYKFANVAF